MNRTQFLESLLEEISQSCNTMSGFAAEVGETYQMHAVQAMAERVGAIAELGIGSGIDVGYHLIGVDKSEGLPRTPLLAPDQGAMDVAPVAQEAQNLKPDRNHDSEKCRYWAEYTHLDGFVSCASGSNEAEWRKEVALHASYAIDCLFDSYGPSATLKPGSDLRLRELNGVIMSVHGGEDERSTFEMADVVFGVDGWTRHDVEAASSTDPVDLLVEAKPAPEVDTAAFRGALAFKALLQTSAKVDADTLEEDRENEVSSIAEIASCVERVIGEIAASSDTGYRRGFCLALAKSIALQCDTGNFGEDWDPRSDAYWFGDAFENAGGIDPFDSDSLGYSQVERRIDYAALMEERATSKHSEACNSDIRMGARFAWETLKSMARNEFGVGEQAPVNYVLMAKLLDQAFVEGVEDSGSHFFRVGFMLTITLYLHSGFCGAPLGVDFLTWDPVGELVSESLVTPDPVPQPAKRKAVAKKRQAVAA